MQPSETPLESPPTPLPMTLKTERLELRQFADSDADVVEKLLNDKEIAANTRSIDYPYPPGDALKWIGRHQEMWQNGDNFVFAIGRPSNNQPMGAIELAVNKIDHNAELGYWLGREHWNNGFCTEAGKRILEFGFEEIGLHRITAHHMTRNPASGQVLKKIGMTQEGILRNHVRKWGVFEDVVLYGMLARDPRP